MGEPHSDEVQAFSSLKLAVSFPNGFSIIKCVKPPSSARACAEIISLQAPAYALTAAVRRVMIVIAAATPFPAVCELRANQQREYRLRRLYTDRIVS